MAITRADVNTDITAKITGQTTAKSITPIIDGANRVLMMDYVDQEITTVNTEISATESVSNKSTDVTADGSSNTKYPSVKAAKDYVDNNFSLSELRSNKSINVVTDGASDLKYPSVKAVKTYVDATVGYKIWRAKVSPSAVLTVFKDEIGFTSPVVTSPANGVVSFQKIGFFTGIDVNKIEFISETFDNFGSPYVTLLARGLYTSDSIELNIYDMAGGQTSTPSGFCVIEIRVYN